MNPNRRSVLKSTSALGLLVACGLVSSRQALAATGREGFGVKNLAEALAMLGGTAADSKDIVITSPDIAENGAVVPVGVASAIPGTSEIYLFVEKNPNPLAAVFRFPDDTVAAVQSRVKMGQSTNVLAVVKTADGKLFSASKETKVTLGGCGG
ncbi:thiosulfate oxidation carrier protein SoxY [Oxalobacteraceae bacterium]|nr:thiosulfate oxidation carrier protein SoxY [Oxalobacteraceae bacterium]